MHHHHISLISGLFPRSLALLPSMILMNVCLEGFQKGYWKQRAERTICRVKLEFQKYPYSFLDNEKRSACIALWRSWNRGNCDRNGGIREHCSGCSRSHQRLCVRYQIDSKWVYGSKNGNTKLLVCGKGVEL